MRSFWLSLRETFEVVIIAVVTVVIIRTFLVQPFLVSGASMEPTFSSGNYLLVDELSYHFREPKRGEVIVFRYPNDRSVFFIKRIVGLPNERVIIRDGRVFINNEELKENYLPSSLLTSGNLDMRLGANEYFVIGDNRYYSFDSRNWGPIQRSDIVGIARLRIFPFNRFAAFSYNFQ